MIKIPKEILEIIKSTKIIPLSTCSYENIPNVVPIGAFDLDTSREEQDILYIMDNYLLKTMENIKVNPYVSFYVHSIENKKCIQIKGKVIDIIDNGKEYEKYKLKYKSINSMLPCKRILKIEIIELYECKSGETAGKLIKN